MKTSSQLEHMLIRVHSIIHKQGLYTCLSSHRSHVGDPRCVFLYFIKEACFVTPRILRSKSNTYYMKAVHFPVIPGHFVYHVEAHTMLLSYKVLIRGLVCHYGIKMERIWLLVRCWRSEKKKKRWREVNELQSPPVLLQNQSAAFVSLDYGGWFMLLIFWSIRKTDKRISEEETRLWTLLALI